MMRGAMRHLPPCHRRAGRVGAGAVTSGAPLGEQVCGAHHSKLGCTLGASSAKASAESSNRMRRFQWDNAVSEQAKPVGAGVEMASAVQPVGQFISHSTNSGFKLRRGVEDAPPSVEVSGTGRAERDVWSACPLIRISSLRFPLRLVWPPLIIPTVGVCQSCSAA